MRLLRNQYYHLKPFLPWRLRMALRRWLAKRKLAKCHDVWPIKHGSEQPPKDWPGWPDGKQFAVVLTHDVEGPKGLARVKQLAELEMNLGFRSAFNFIPEGDYRVSQDLLEWLRAHGFEIGVHDLYHEGKLYDSRKSFSESAKRINQYLEKWGAVGFRSGFMHHNLDWLHDLNIEYDASTFDTDPFEPQPDGVNTIFPFWVPAPLGKRSAVRGQGAEVGSQRSEARDQRSAGPSRQADLLRSPTSSPRGYVELPYTLPQDSTLFILLRESSLDIWKKKLDWIAEHGGMMLLDVHPDYMSFDGSPPNRTEYLSARYVELLKHVKQRFGSHYWHSNPSQVARWYAANRRSTSNTDEKAIIKGDLNGKKAAVVVYSYYLSDPRPRREAEALAMAGMEVDVICLRQNPREHTCETVNGVNVRRMPVSRRRDSKLTYLVQYGYFITLCAANLAYRSVRKRYDLIHVHNMPDVLVFSALVPKLLGAKIILDLHDPMPELMMTIFNLRQESLVVRFLKGMEKRSIGFADLVLTPNTAFKRLFTSRSCPPEKMQIVMNSPNEEIFRFHPVNATAPGGRNPADHFVILYHGSLVARHGLDFAIDALEAVRKSIPAATLMICGESTPYFEAIMKSVEQRGLRQAVRYMGMRNRRQIVEAIEECDLGIIPNRRSVFTEINMPTRIFEYLALAKPVIAPSTQGIQDYFRGRDLIFFEPDNVADLARKIEYAASNPEEVRDIIERGQAVYQKYLWKHERSVFMELTCDLLMLGDH